MKVIVCVLLLMLSISWICPFIFSFIFSSSLTLFECWAYAPVHRLISYKQWKIVVLEMFLVCVGRFSSQLKTRRTWLRVFSLCTHTKPLWKCFKTGTASARTEPIQHNWKQNWIFIIVLHFVAYCVPILFRRVLGLTLESHLKRTGWNVGQWVKVFLYCECRSTMLNGWKNVIECVTRLYSIERLAWKEKKTEIDIAFSQ